MKRVIVGVWLLALAVPALADPPRRRAGDKKFWLTLAALGAAMVADGESQLRLQRSCAVCTESNPLYFARRPGRVRFYLVGSGIFAGQVLLARRMKTAESWPARIWWIPAAAETAFHVRYAVHNLRLPPYHGCPAGQTINCTR